MTPILIWGIIGVFVVPQSSRFPYFSRLFHTGTAPLPPELKTSPEPHGTRIPLAIPEKYLVPYHQIIAALSSHTRKGTLLFTGVAGLAIGAGALVLFVDMPLYLLGVLSVLSLAALGLAVVSARIRFFPSATPEVQDTTPPAPQTTLPEHSPEPAIEPDETEQHDAKKNRTWPAHPL